MLNFHSNFNCCFHSPRTISEALEKLFNKKVLRNFVNVNDSDLIQRISEAQGIHPFRLLVQCAYLLGLEAKTELIPPTPDLIRKCGYSLNALNDKKCVPQPYKNKLCLVVADPTAINIDEWFLFGIPVFLSLGSLVLEALKQNSFDVTELKPSSQGNVGIEWSERFND